jgi:hypothetical protein
MIDCYRYSGHSLYGRKANWNWGEKRTLPLPHLMMAVAAVNEEQFECEPVHIQKSQRPLQSRSSLNSFRRWINPCALPTPQ